MKRIAENQDKEDKIYLSIDHLKKGKYQLHILLNNKVLKSVKISKSK
tara:strand:- start:102846 stop:102986 length:141 start_codon:yes stop_codon:yes gene_type:complete